MSVTRSSPLNRFAWLAVVSIGLMIIDYRSQLLLPVRSLAAVIGLPLETAVRLPELVSEEMRRYYPDASVYDELQNLQARRAELEVRLQRLETLQQENKRLAGLLSSSRANTDEVLLTEIIDFGLPPFSRKIVVDRGIESGVFVGQPAIAPQGVLGQVSRTSFRRSVITLISDPGHGLPVQIQRNGLRTIAQGAGVMDRIEVPYLESQADVRTGDILVTSGVGGRFPVGYKVAEIVDIVKNANDAFLTITAATTAKLGYTKEVLLIWSTDSLGNSRLPQVSRAPAVRSKALQAPENTPRPDDE